MFVTGAGIGLVMQVLVVAVQNAVGYEDLGVATSGNTLLRNIGSSVGTAIIGTVFATELAGHLRQSFPSVPSTQLGVSHLSASQLARLPVPVRQKVLVAFSASLDTAFRVAAFVSIAAFVASWFIKQLPMRTTVTAEGVGESFGVPRTGDSLAEMARALAVLVGRKEMRAWLQRVAHDAGVDLPLVDCWVLVNLRRTPGSSLRDLAARHRIPSASVAEGLRDAVARGLVAVPVPSAPASDGGGELPPGHDSAAGGGGAGPVLTPDGEAVADVLIEAVRRRLVAMLDGWSPEDYPELVRLLDRVSAEVVPGRDELVTAGSRPLER
jgi:DNA-binding MarR family transcriptional regulator